MKRKEFVVFGVGDFGMYVAKTLANSGAAVMVVDKDEERLEQIASEVTRTICADATNPEAVKQLGIGNYDGAIIGIGDQCFDYDAVKRVECAIYHGKGIH